MSGPVTGTLTGTMGHPSRAIASPGSTAWAGPMPSESLLRRPPRNPPILASHPLTVPLHQCLGSPEWAHEVARAPVRVGGAPARFSAVLRGFWTVLAVRTAGGLQHLDCSGMRIAELLERTRMQAASRGERRRRAPRSVGSFQGSIAARGCQIVRLSRTRAAAMAIPAQEAQRKTRNKARPHGLARLLLYCGARPSTG